MRRMTDRYPAVIVVHASFNPVHEQHIRMVIEAHDCLEKAGYCVSKGILAITDRSRLVEKGVEAITDAHRLAALKYACDGIDWLVPERRGVKYGSGRQLAEELAGELRKKNPQEPQPWIFVVVGADIAVRYPHDLRGPTVVVGRKGLSFSESAYLVQIVEDMAWRRWTFFLVDELPGDECSSTKLRRALGQDDEEAVEKAVRAMCQNNRVADYLLDHRKQLYSCAGCGRADLEYNRDGSNSWYMFYCHECWEKWN